MEKKYTIQKEKTNNSYILTAPNTGMFKSFPTSWYENINIIRGICSNIVKEHSKKYFGKNDKIILIDETEIKHLICHNCGSTDVDVKAWIGEQTGNISYLDEMETEDCYCNKCEKHIKVETSNQHFIVYQSN